jgi:hypothetical protein
MVKRYKGGLMSSSEATTSISSATGMWGTVQATQARYSGNWPSLLSTETPGSSGAGSSVTVSNVAVTDGSYTVLDDTPNISTAGGFIRVTGSGFASGCVVYIGGTAATTTTFVSSTEVRAVVPAASSNTLMVYVVNPNGSTGIKLNSLVFSGTPTWSTGATLPSQATDAAFSIQLSATSDSSITYSLAVGSSLPPGTSLSSGGVFSGTVTGLSNDTTYSFTVNAVDVENQDTSRAFSVTISIGDQYFYLTPVLLNGDANVWIRDSSVNTFLPTVGGDTRPVAFSPYNSNWSVLFNGSSDSLTVPAGADFAYGTGDFTVEGWFYVTSTLAAFGSMLWSQSTSGNNYFYVAAGEGANPVVNNYIQFIGTPSGGGTPIYSSTTFTRNTWNHFAVVRISGSVRVYLNGVGGTSTSNTTDFTNTSFVPNIGRYTDGTSWFPGYISNLRVVKGVGVYTGNFTVPTGALTATQSSGTNIAAITAGQTVFLGLQTNRLIDASTTPKIITAGGTPQVTSFTPFTDTDLITGSAYFDGTTDFLTIADNAALELGAGDFCVELWIYPTSVSVTGTIIDKRVTGYAPLLFWRLGTTLQLYMSTNGSSWNLVNGVTVGTVAANRWYHIAIYRVGSTIYSAFNGVVSTVTASGSGTLLNNAGSWYIGTGVDGSTDPYTGYIADMRFVIGSGVYTGSNFTPPATSLTAITNTQLLTLQYRLGNNNHRFVDDSGIRALTTRTGNASQGSFSPFSPTGWSASFDGTGDYLTVTGSSNLAFGTNDFTIEMFVWFNGTGQVNFYDQRPQSTNGLYPTIYVTGSAFIAYRTNSADRITSDAVITANRWYHLVVSRVSSVTRMFIDGTQQTQTYSDTNSYLNGTTRPVIGSGGDGQTVVLNGYISNLRVLNGTGYTTVTVPTSRLTTTSQGASNCQLLTLQDNRFVDNSSNNYVITRVADAKIQAFSPFRPSGSYSPATHGGSAYFDGSGDSITIANSPVMTLLTNNHTIEFWMYLNGTQNQYSVPWWYNGPIAYYFSVGSEAGGDVTLLVGGGAPWTLAITIGNTEYLKLLNNWSHVVITRSGTAFRMFFNGVLRAYGTASQSISAQTGSFIIGWDGINATTYYKGWLTNFRVINGSIPTAYQTSSTTLGTTIFTPPTSVPAFEANTAMAMNFTNSGIVNTTGRNVFETAGAVTISNVASKFGIGSISFPGALTAYLVTPTSPNIDFGTGDFTVECWVYFNSVASDQGLFGGSSTGAWEIRWRTSTGLNLGRLNTAFDSIFAWSPLAATWYHVAVTRSGTSVRGFVNGSQIGTTSTNSNTYNSGTLFYIGITDTSNNAFNGYLDDVRITKGFARYTANFTAPTSAFLTK